MNDVTVIGYVPARRRWLLALSRAARHLSRQHLTFEERLVFEHAVDVSRGEAVSVFSDSTTEEAAQ